MPSDCQCSSVYACETIVKTKVLNNKQATSRIRELEREVKELKEENSLLKMNKRKKTPTKKDLVAQLRRHLDRI